MNEIDQIKAIATMIFNNDTLITSVYRTPDSQLSVYVDVELKENVFMHWHRYIRFLEMIQVFNIRYVELFTRNKELIMVSNYTISGKALKAVQFNAVTTLEDILPYAFTYHMNDELINDYCTDLKQEA